MSNKPTLYLLDYSNFKRLSLYNQSLKEGLLLKKVSNSDENKSYIHICIIGHYNPSVRIIDLVSHTNYVVCVNFIHKWRELQFKVDSFHGRFLFTLRVFVRNLMRGNCRRNTFFVFCFDVWPVTLPTRPRRLHCM